jgi:hypothetical protein
MSVQNEVKFFNSSRQSIGASGGDVGTPWNHSI